MRMVVMLSLAVFASANPYLSASPDRVPQRSPDAVRKATRLAMLGYQGESTTLIADAPRKKVKKVKRRVPPFDHNAYWLKGPGPSSDARFGQ